MTEPLYDRIGVGYGKLRREDPRIAARIHAALGDARTVVNVGAGAGSYEPCNREVVAVEPSAVMRAQRPPGAAPTIAAAAEALPFADGSFDAAMAVLTDHHWSDRFAGLREMRRVTRRVAVLFQWDPATVRDFWLTRDYLPSFAAAPAAPFARIAETLGATRTEIVPIPHDCTDGFLAAYWRRPEAYFDPQVRACISVFALLDPGAVAAGLARLRDDLDTGAWHAHNADLLECDAIDLGYRLIIAEYDGRAGRTKMRILPDEASETMTQAERGFGEDDFLETAREAELEASGGEGPSPVGVEDLRPAREAELEASGGEGPSPDSGGLLGASQGDVLANPDDLPVAADDD